jgi:hypothetical protein
MMQRSSSPEPHRGLAETIRRVLRTDIGFMFCAVAAVLIMGATYELLDIPRVGERCSQFAHMEVIVAPRSSRRITVVCLDSGDGLRYFERK